MKKTKFDIGNITSLTMDISCDLKLLGWDRPEIFTEADEDVLSVKADGTSAKINCECDVIISLPASVRIDRLNVGGDASIVDFRGSIDNADIGGDCEIARGGGVSIRQIGGDLQIRQMSDNCSIGRVGGDFEGKSFEKNLLITTVDGDCSISDVHGEMEIKSVGGDCIIRSIQGGATLQNVGGDCQIDGVVKGLLNSKIGGDLLSPNLTGDISIFAGGDISASVSGTEIQKVFLNAGGDISLHFGAQPSAKFELRSSEDGTRLHFDNRKEKLESSYNEFELGAGEGMFKLEAGGELLLTQQPFNEKFGHLPFQHFDSTFEKVMEKLKQRIDLDERIAEKADLISERASRHAERISRNVEAKLSKAMEKLEKHLDSEKFGFESGTTWQETKQSVPVEKPVQVSDEEKTLILKMLQEKKISPEEAEKLFEALENKGN